MNHCIAVVTDLIFSTRIRSTASSLGANCTMVAGLDALRAALQSNAPRIALVDMNCDGLSATDAIKIFRAQSDQTHVIAFLSHVQTELQSEAQEAGANEVLPRSTFVQKLPELFRELAETS